MLKVAPVLRNFEYAMFVVRVLARVGCAFSVEVTSCRSLVGGVAAGRSNLVVPGRRRSIAHPPGGAARPKCGNAFFVPRGSVVTMASTSTWLKGSEYCFPLAYDHSVAMPAVATLSCPSAEVVTALMASALQKDRLDIPFSTDRSRCSFIKPSDNLSDEKTCQALALTAGSSLQNTYSLANCGIPLLFPSDFRFHRHT